MMELQERESAWVVSLLIVAFSSQAMLVNGQANGTLRLTGFESSRLAGRVEVHFFGQWYTVCNDFFTLREAAVVCRQLGLGYPVRIFNPDTDGPDKMSTSDSPFSRFGFGSGIHAMDDVLCTGEEPHILSCSYGALGGVHNCAIWESVGVQCSDLYPQPYSGQVRLEGEEFPSSGRLEVYFSGQWGAVCGEGTLDANLPTTVCRQLGFSSGTGQAIRNAQSVPVWLTSVSCYSSSTCLSSCLASAPTATQTCSNNTYISISCDHDARPVRDYGTKDRCEMTSSNPGEGSLRLVGGATNNAGVVQVYRSGRWGGICASGLQYDSESLEVACRQLGYRSWHSAGSANFTDSPSNFGRLSVDCNGGEQRITDCSITAEERSSCTIQFYLICSTGWNAQLYGAVLLTGGGGASGTLAVDGIGSLCDNPFSLATGDVACRQMGYEGARAVKKGSFYGSPAFLVGTSVVCSRTEQNLTACRLMNCSGTPTTAAGVQCIVNSSDSDRGNLRLFGGSSTAGRLQMQLDGEWTQVCSDGFNTTAANVACSQLLGLRSTGTVHTDGRYGNTNTSTLVVPWCIGTEAKLYDCIYYSVDSRLCTSDVALECCSLICENGGALTTNCTCDCVDGFSGMNCSRVSCGEPDSLSNGRVDTSAGTSFGDVASYSCDTGYTLNGTAVRTCQANREWSGSVPTCERVSCGQPDIPINGRVDTSAGTSFGDVARYSCNIGYTLNGPADRTCQADGRWNGSVPTCETPLVDCDIPQSFPNGTFILVNGSTTLNSTVKYECRLGLQLVGSDNRICQSNGQWSGQEPMCKSISCGQLFNQSNGYVNTSAGTSFGDVARYSCDTGYTLQNGPAERTCQADGQWNGSVPTCERVFCGQPDAPSNGRVNTSAGTSFGDVARYSCDTGYTRNGTAERTCQMSGEWSGSVPTCERISCGQLGDPINGRVDTSAGTSFGDVARYSCDTGYTVNGPAERTCQANRQWSGSVPTCERDSCGQPDIPSNGRVDTSAGTSFGDVARYSCDRGYTRNGPAERTCQANGQWSGSVPTCEIVDCGPLESITNGNVMVNGGTTFNRIAMYNCSSGYHLVRMAIRICQSSGQWSGSAPRCERNFCPQSFFFPLGVPKTPASTQARMSCSELDDSFLPDGSITALCSNDGIWGPLDMSQCTFRKDAPVVAVAVVETPLAMIEAMGAFGQVTTLSMLDNQTVLTIRMISDNERNDFNAFISNSSTPISTLLVSQKKESCDCCDFSAVEVLQRVTPSSSSLPTPAISVSFNVCTGLPEAPQACTCSNRRLACLRRFSFTSSSRLCSLDVDEDGVVDTEDSCVGCCLPSFELAFQWPRTLHRTTAELDCSKIHDSFSDTKVRRRCLPDDSWGPADISSCTFKNRTRNTIFLLSTNVTISGEHNREDVLDEIQTIFENQLPNLTDVATLSNSSYNITTLTVQSSTRNGSSVTTVVFIVDFQNNVTLPENAMAVEEELDDNEITYTFGDLVGVTPSNSCPCRAGGGQIAHLCLGNSLSPCDCTDLGTCECIDPYINDTVTKQCSLDTDGDMIPDYRDSCKTEFWKDEPGCPPPVPSTEGCPAETDTDWRIEWPVAAIGSTQSVRCPGEGDVPGLGLAHRSCLTGGVWGSVDASDCGSVAVREVSMQRENFVNSLQETNSTNLTLTPDQRMVIQNISQSLNAALEPSDDGGTKTIPPRDLTTTAEFVETIADLGENNDLFDAETNETQEVVADILSNVLDERNSPAFEATATDTGTAVAQGGDTASPATSILQSTERVANVIVNTLSVKRRITISRPNLGLHGERFPFRRAGGFTFPGPGVMLPQFRRPESIPQIRFPRAFLFAARGIEMPPDATPPTPTTSSEMTPPLTTTGAASPSPTPTTIPTIVPPEDNIEVVNVVMNNMENYLPTDVEAVEDSDVEAEETQAASLVFSSQIPGYDGGEVNTTETVEITFPLIEQATNLTVPPGRRKQFRCAFFNFTGGANRTGGWSYSGVQTEVINETHVRCNAAHLTSFVVLVSIVPAADIPVDPLDYITYIGCSISFLCLLACIAFFLSLRKELIQKLHNFVHLNLCIALALGLLLFLTGIQTATANVYACKVVTAFLHYFFLATFTWSLCEAVLIYILLVKVFGANDKNWIYLYLALGWVLPIPIVVISGGVRNKDYLIRYSFNESHPNYDKFKACWLPTEHYTIFAFIGPMVAIIVVNAVLLTISLGSLAKSQLGKTVSEMTPEKDERRKEYMEVGKRLFKATIILVPVMGFTWIIGLFAVGEEGKVFAYLFVIANAFQGLFIFIFHVLRHEKVYGKIKSCLPKLKGISTSTGTASTAGSSRSRSNKSKWVDSKKSTSLAAESEAFIEYGQKKEDDAVSIHEGGDLEMKLKIIDETTEGQGQGDKEVDKPVAVANTSFEASTSAEGIRDEEENGKDDEDKQEADSCDVDEEQAKDPVVPTSTATAFGVQSEDKADNGKDTCSSDGN